MRIRRITRRLISAAEKLCVVASIRVGIETIDVKAATEAGVFVIRIAGTNADSVAEHTFDLLLYPSRFLLRSQDVEELLGHLPVFSGAAPGRNLQNIDLHQLHWRTHLLINEMLDLPMPREFPGQLISSKRIVTQGV